MSITAAARIGLRPVAATDRAWGVVAGAFLVTMLGYGAIYSCAAFAEAIAAEFGASRAAVMLIYGLSGGTCLLVSALTGPLADRIGAGVVAAVGMVLVAAGFLTAAAASSLIEVLVGYGLLVGLGAGCAYVPALALVQRCFAQHRGLASGLAVSGSGVGTVLVPPAAALLAGLGDWRAGFVAFALACAVLGLLGAALLRAPHGLRPAPRRAPEPGGARITVPPGFARTCAAVLLVSVPAALPHALLVASARDLGFAAETALGLLGLIGLGTLAGRFLLAALADVLGRGRVFLFCCAGMPASMLAWAFAFEMWELQAFALGFGALHGGFVALLPAVVADRFGPRGLGGVLGLLYAGRGCVLLLVPSAVAWAAVALGGPALALVAAAAAGLAGTVLLLRRGADG